MEGKALLSKSKTIQNNTNSAPKGPR
ncbi:hypothetical protein CCACVL1_03327 [Corchorus capsularis]|uniref:Uncharacterized protein n=1 Tax=Corchorus capsularis TaxID=210143 RepID=A0A1R3K0M6_COCAP|nr:hypothetical protein CCACVL1_03327 [Corchorus capsularis]